LSGVTAPPDDAAFAELVAACWPGLYRTAYLMLGDHQLAEDLAQTALVRTYASWGRVRDVAAAPGYARVVLARTAASWFRRRSWRNERPTETLPEPAYERDPSDRPAVIAALGALPPRQRAVVVLRYFDDLGVREVADALGIGEGTVKSQTSHALAKLRVLLGDEISLSEGAHHD
jgi:RNA polymerase sigma-70 factor (sigma-E family)